MERCKAGIVDPVEEAAEQPIGKHLDDYIKHLKQKDNSPRYVRDTRVKLKKMIQAENWQRAAHIWATDVQAYLGNLADQGLGVRTRNTYLAAVKSFARWLYRNRRLRDDPLLHLAPVATVTVAASYSKRRRADVQVLHPMIAAPPR